jgi:predicted O-methyltransferase YrrM
MQLHINNFVKTDISHLKKFVEWSDDGKLFENNGQHYRLLAYISSILPNGSKIFEIGTRWGVSAVALSNNKNVSVITCDIDDCIEDSPSVKDIPNVTCVIGDGFNLIDEHINAEVIFMDVDPHDGVQETRMINKLIECEYKGILFLDDIHLNKEMNDFWNSIQLDKVDLTQFGHYSGTGIVFFGDQEFKILQTLRSVHTDC